MSYWKKSPFGTPADLRSSWPIQHNNTDPWAGDELSGALHSSDYWEALNCSQKHQRYLEQARKDGLKIQPFHDRSIIHDCESVLSDSQLASIAEDWVPDIGIFAEERVLGPFAPQYKLRTLCGAILSFSSLLEHNFTPAGQYGSLKSRKKGSHSLGIQAKTPAMLWRVNPNQSLSALLPIEERYKPKGPFLGLPQTPFIIARVIKTISGYQTSTVLPLAVAQPTYVFNRIRLEWVRLQYQNRYIYWEDILRFRSELLYRTSLEYCFINNYKETKQCLHTYF